MGQKNTCVEVPLTITETHSNPVTHNPVCKFIVKAALGIPVHQFVNSEGKKKLI